ncbi:hypothetical protein HJG54_15555 [Leptolyngbya sp. NK1-12]|uniref:Uncharacterized protein n=1 Tax=Leptolyngbya sp. NK1-12 TaxID=2547451 RepID=A0AA97AH36_9CYAN|nr:hypothetical protein [Leptolyngbya sp. NK1-12]WNZ24134.1 hypothetical protein HJG54_15555 [Leptolyngbya sp. NK1-12]
MLERVPVQANTLQSIASELIGVPISADLATEHVAVIENFMRDVEKLRALPIKEIVPPLVFIPEEDKR